MPQETVHQGVDREAGDGLDAELLADVLAVGGDGEDRNAEFVGDFLVRKALRHFGDNLLLAVGEDAAGLVGVGLPGRGVGLGVIASGVLLLVLLKHLGQGQQHAVFDGSVAPEDVLALENLDKDIVAHIARGTAWKVVHDDVLEVFQLLFHVAVHLGDHPDGEQRIALAAQQALDVAEDHVFLEVYVALHLGVEAVEEAAYYVAVFGSTELSHLVDIFVEGYRRDLQIMFVGDPQETQQHGDVGRAERIEVDLRIVCSVDVAEDGEELGIDAARDADLVEREVAEAELEAQLAHKVEDLGVVSDHPSEFPVCHSGCKYTQL